jgi:excisionase family DNA binding protein
LRLGKNRPPHLAREGLKSFKPITRKRVQRFLSSKDAAAVLGVSESSLKRWADGGKLRVTRTAGGHRRIKAPEIIRFSRANDLPIVRPDILGLPTPMPQRHNQTHERGNEPLGEVLYDQLRHGRDAEFRSTVIERYLAGDSIASLCDGPIREAMERMGQLWKHDDRGIAFEHRATDACIQTLSMLRTVIQGGAADVPNLSGETDQPDTERPIALGGAPAGDPYLLPSLMVACVVADLGYRGINLGPNTPLDSLRAAAKHHRPSLVWLSCTATHSPQPDAHTLTRAAQQLAQLGTPLVVGGRSLTKLPPQPPPNLHVCRTLSELAAFARGLLTRP